MSQIKIETGVSLVTADERNEYIRGYRWGHQFRYTLTPAQQRGIAQREQLDKFTEGAQDALEGKEQKYVE